MRVPISLIGTIPASYRTRQSLDEAIHRTKEAIAHMAHRGFQRWLVMYSGGKDSTAAALLTIEALKHAPATIEVCYTDTRVEIPTLSAYAKMFLEHLATQRNVTIRHFTPSPEDSFWVQIIGKGYPTPRSRFRWCTSRLKIKPIERYLETLSPEERAQTLICTGIRFGESDVRDYRIKLSCQRGGECSQGVWYFQSERAGVGYFAPLLTWRECDVWDFLNFIAPCWGYPTHTLQDVYKGRETRFGCWTCTVVSQDRTMQKIVQDQPEYAPLLEFREWLIEFVRIPEHRVHRANGTPGRLTLSARRRILEQLRTLEQRIGRALLSSIEYNCITQYWEDPRYGDQYIHEEENGALRTEQ